MIPTYSTEKPQGKEQNTETFVEVGYFQLCKYNQKTEGDVFLSQKNPADGRVITTLSLTDWVRELKPEFWQL